MFTLTSSQFLDNSPIPARYTCDGRDTSPPLSWSQPPQGTKSLVLIVDDPDAPEMTWVHWLLYNIPPSIDGLAEGIGQERLPKSTRQGTNSWQRTGYGGPCPPIGRHRYFFKLYALDILLPDIQQPGKKQLEQAMQGHVIAKTQLMGTYQRQR